MTDDNPYRSPLAEGSVLQPTTWLRRGWSDAPGVVAAVIGILMLTIAVVGMVAMAVGGSPRTAVITGIGFFVWSLAWFAAAQTWWKGQVFSSIVWTGLALAPAWIMLAMTFMA
jgi:hypothetical protein